MIPVARRLLLRNRGGLIVTVSGIAATVALMLFLFAVHDGAKDGSTRYVRTAKIDIWILQKNADNILKSSSFVRTSLAEEISEIDGVAIASPLSRLITKATVRGRRTSTIFILAFDPLTKVGAPTTIAEGSADLKPGEIILDRAFVARYDLAIGDSLEIQGRTFRVAGISEGTNALLSQFGFARLDDAEEILGLAGISSFIALRLERPADSAEVARRIRAKFPDLAVHESADFIRFHEEEADAGLLPVFATAAAFGAIVCAFIVALMLYTSVLHRREDYATLKALGASQRYLLRIVLGQALLVTALGCFFGGVIVAVLTPLLREVVPTIALRYPPWLLVIIPMTLSIGAIAAAAPLRLLRRIYPAEVFRA
ncbi:MAG TPA: FtsX-like permease family protein [Thermoanaerobaculia bacterium]|jgi:putative ABC transport system permease protein|nr:FtsX-like permease family protein [Thermoanaerobaculia bacterium]